MRLCEPKGRVHAEFEATILEVSGRVPQAHAQHGPQVSAFSWHAAACLSGGLLDICIVDMASRAFCRSFKTWLPLSHEAAEGFFKVSVDAGPNGWGWLRQDQRLRLQPRCVSL